PFVLSGMSSSRIETIANIYPEGTWCQIYVSTNSNITDDMLDRATGSGVDVLVVTIDFPIPVRSEPNERRGISPQFDTMFRMFLNVLPDALSHPRWFLSVARN